MLIYWLLCRIFLIAFVSANFNFLDIGYVCSLFIR
jgi:hypothetical protein